MNRVILTEIFLTMMITKKLQIKRELSLDIVENTDYFRRLLE